MKIKLLFIFLLFSSAITAADNSDPNSGAKIIGINTDQFVLEEWKYPGRYSPVMAFDGDINTAFAEGGGGADLGLGVTFNRPVYIDEIRIMNGFGRNDELFKKNNRGCGGAIFLQKGKKLIKEERFTLKDQREFQSIKLDQGYAVDIFSMYLNDNKYYKGTTYNDTCITEIEFWYKGRKIEVNNAKELQQEYLNRLDRILAKAFNGRDYLEAGGGQISISFNKNGTVSFSDTGDCGKDGTVCMSSYINRFWKIENLKLYTRNSEDEKWALARYTIYMKSDDIIKTLTICKDPNKTGAYDCLGMLDRIEALK